MMLVRADLRCIDHARALPVHAQIDSNDPLSTEAVITGNIYYNQVSIPVRVREEQVRAGDLEKVPSSRRVEVDLEPFAASAAGVDPTS